MADDTQEGREHADLWMRQNKSTLPGPLTDSDWEQLRDLLAVYGQERYEQGKRDALTAPQQSHSSLPRSGEELEL